MKPNQSNVPWATFLFLALNPTSHAAQSRPYRIFIKDSCLTPQERIEIYRSSYRKITPPSSTPTFSPNAFAFYFPEVEYVIHEPTYSPTLEPTYSSTEPTSLVPLSTDAQVESHKSNLFSMILPKSSIDTLFDNGNQRRLGKQSTSPWNDDDDRSNWPSFSSSPSEIPSLLPSQDPTSSPSVDSTEAPSSLPSMSPSQVPSAAPSTDWRIRCATNSPTAHTQDNEDSGEFQTSTGTYSDSQGGYTDYGSEDVEADEIRDVPSGAGIGVFGDSGSDTQTEQADESQNLITIDIGTALILVDGLSGTVQTVEFQSETAQNENQVNLNIITGDSITIGVGTAIVIVNIHQGDVSNGESQSSTGEPIVINVNDILHSENNLEEGDTVIVVDGETGAYVTESGGGFTGGTQGSGMSDGEEISQQSDQSDVGDIVDSGSGGYSSSGGDEPIIIDVGSASTNNEEFDQGGVITTVYALSDLDQTEGGGEGEVATVDGFDEEVISTSSLETEGFSQTPSTSNSPSDGPTDMQFISYEQIMSPSQNPSKMYSYAPSFSQIPSIRISNTSPISNSPSIASSEAPSYSHSPSEIGSVESTNQNPDQAGWTEGDDFTQIDTAGSGDGDTLDAIDTLDDKEDQELVPQEDSSDENGDGINNNLFAEAEGGISNTTGLDQIHNVMSRICEALQNEEVYTTDNPLEIEFTYEVVVNQDFDVDLLVLAMDEQLAHAVGEEVIDCNDFNHGRTLQQGGEVQGIENSSDVITDADCAYYTVEDGTLPANSECHVVQGLMTLYLNDTQSGSIREQVQAILERILNEEGDELFNAIEGLEGVHYNNGDAPVSTNEETSIDEFTGIAEEEEQTETLMTSWASRIGMISVGSIALVALTFLFYRRKRIDKNPESFQKFEEDASVDTTHAETETRDFFVDINEGIDEEVNLSSDVLSTGERVYGSIPLGTTTEL